MPKPKKRSTRRRSRRQRKVCGGKDVVVVYEIGGSEGPKIKGVFNTLEDATKKVEVLIGELNKSLGEDSHFKLEVREEDGMMAWSESEPNSFYFQKNVPYEESK